MSSSSSLAINNKRRRLNNNDINTIFNHEEDEKQCIQLINVLDSLAYITQINEMLILKEISEYATGNFINCQGGSLLHPCHGTIPFLYGNNFNLVLLFGEQYTNDLSLYSYECSDYQCTKKVHIFACKGCNELAHIPVFPSDGCGAARLRLCDPISKYRACSMRNNCDGIYCRRCCKAYMIYCGECDEYYCRACIKSNSGYCKGAHYFEYPCNYCEILYISSDHSKTKYCDDCVWCFERYRFASAFNEILL